MTPGSDAKRLERDPRPATPHVDVVWICGGTLLGFSLSSSAAQTAVAAIFAVALLLVSFRSPLAGVSAVLCAIVFSARVEMFGHWMYSLHLVVSVVFTALLWQVAKRSSRSREILGIASTLGGLALLARFAGTALSKAAGFDIAFVAQLGFLALLPRFLYTLWRESSAAFAWCSSMFFLLLAVAALASGVGPYPWSFLRYVELWTMAALAAAALSADQTRRLLWLLGLLAMAVGMLGVAEHFGFVPADPFPVGSYTRASATFGQPNPLGGFLATAVAAIFGLSLQVSGRQANVARCMLLILSSGLFATSSRGAIAACTVALLVVAVFGRRGSGIRRSVLGLALVGAGSIPFWLNGTLMARWGISAPAPMVQPDTSAPAAVPVVPPEAGGIAQRSTGLRTGVKIVENDPWFGVGPGRYSDAVASYAPTQLDETYYDNHIHNLYLQIWIESGVFVVAAFLAGLFVFFVQSVRWLDGAPTLILPAVGIVVAMCTHNLFDVVFVHGMQILFGFALAAPAIANRQKKGA